MKNIGIFHSLFPIKGKLLMLDWRKISKCFNKNAMLNIKRPSLFFFFFYSFPLLFFFPLSLLLSYVGLLSSVFPLGQADNGDFQLSLNWNYQQTEKFPWQWHWQCLRVKTDDEETLIVKCCKLSLLNEEK